MHQWMTDWNLQKQNGHPNVKCRMSVNYPVRNKQKTTVPFPRFNVSNTVRATVATPPQHPHSLVAGTLVPLVRSPRQRLPLGCPESRHYHSATRFQAGLSQWSDHRSLPQRHRRCFEQPLGSFQGRLKVGTRCHCNGVCMRPLEVKVEPTYEDDRQSVFIKWWHLWNQTRTHLFCIGLRIPWRVG